MNIEETDQDFFSAIKTCKKKRIGPNREDNNRILFYKKDMSILARAGFNYETSKKVLDLTKKDYEKFLGLLWRFIFLFSLAGKNQFFFWLDF